MKPRLLEFAPWLALIAALASLHLSTSRGALDDLSVLYANAWLETCQESDATPGLLRAHFEQYGAELSPVEHGRFSRRLELGGNNNYTLLARLIRWAEGLGAPPGLRTVMAADLTEHLIAALGLLAVLGRRQPWLAPALLAGAFLGMLRLPVHAEAFFPFQGSNMSWFSSYPRGASTLAWFGAVAVVFSLEGAARFVLAALFLALSVVCHRSMAMLCFAMTLPALGLWWAVQGRIPRRPRRAALVALFLGVLLAVAGLKLALLVHYDSQGFFPLNPARRGEAGTFLRPVFTLLSWGVGALGSSLLWLRVRESPELRPEQRRSGDVFAALLTLTGAASLGLNALHSDTELWFGRFFFFTEASMRSIVVPNALVFALLALCQHAWRPSWTPRLSSALAALCCVMAMLQFVKHKNPALPSNPPALATLLASGRRAYENEPRYYFTVARSVATQGCGNEL